MANAAGSARFRTVLVVVSCFAALASGQVLRGQLEIADRIDRILTSRASEHKITRKLFFTHKTNLLRNGELRDHFDNVMKTITAYRGAWGENERVNFFDDKTCSHAVKWASTELLPYYEAEFRGPFRADMCRLASLLKFGGYFFDTDIEVVKAFFPPDDVSFVGVLGCGGNCFLPSFIASSPQHPLLSSALAKLLEIYKQGKDVNKEARPIAFALMEAYKELPQKEQEKVLLMQTLKLDYQLHPYHHVHEHFPELERQPGKGNCNVVIHSLDDEEVYFFEHFLGSGNCQKGLLPRTLWFSYETDILKTQEPKPIYDNVLNTVSAYRGAWGDANAPVHFLDDDACRYMLKEVMPELLPFFNNETIGAYKGDMCRNAALYLHGGYYFDVDIQVVNIVEPKDTTTFISTWACGGGCFFQAFFATVPRHPIVYGSLQKMLAIYKNNEDNLMIGPITMANAYYDLPFEEREKDTEFFEELLLDSELKHYPDVPRQQGAGNCNFVVHRPDEAKIYFFARFLGYGGCQPAVVKGDDREVEAEEEEEENLFPSRSGM